MAFSDKIRAGRAFLQLTQDELADAAGLSLQGLQKIERNEAAPTARTQAKIVRALEKRGVVFTPRGIELVANPVFFVEGGTHEETYLQLLDEVAEHLAGIRQPELLIMYADDRVSPASVRSAYRRLRAGGVAMRQLVEAGNTYLMGPIEEYRYVPSRFFINRVTLIYGGRVARVGAGEMRIVVQADAVQADIERHTFNLLWELLDRPVASDADERF